LNDTNSFSYLYVKGLFTSLCGQAFQIEAEAMYVNFLGEKGGVLGDNHRHFYVVDLKTGVMQELLNCGRVSPFRWIGRHARELHSKKASSQNCYSFQEIVG